MKLIDVEGKEVELTPDVFMKVLSMTFQVAVANTIEYTFGNTETSKNLKRMNKIMDATWSNHEWLENFVSKIYDVSMEDKK